MTRRTSPFTTVRTEGGLLPSELLARVVANDPSLPGIDAAAYHRSGERLNEAIVQSWNRLTGAWTTFRAQLDTLPDTDRATTLTREWMLKLFDELSFGRVPTAKSVELGGNTYAISHRWEHVPIHIVGARIRLDERTEGVAGAARMSPHGLVQDLLNRSDESLWGVVTNGLRLRLLRDSAALTRQAYVEFDLESMFSEQAYADFTVLWLVCHQSRFEGDVPEKCLLEQWMADAAQRGTRALDDLRRNVEAAIGHLGSGFLAHPANAELRQRLAAGELSAHDYYRQILRLVYRLLFLSVAEARDLLCVPGDLTARERYARYYSLNRIRRLAETRRGGPHTDGWVQLQLVMQALGTDTGAPEVALPALGSFLWSANATTDLDGAQLANRPLFDAVRELSQVRDGKVTRTIDYANLGAEELGSVYESLLELHPELHLETATFTLTTAAGNERKTTGSYYTPTSLINELLDSALDPVLDEAAAQPDPESAILALTVCDPACGSGHFLIAAAQRIAKRLATARTGDPEPSPAATRAALRDVVGHCLYGIDVNPMAVELCKVSLWMEAMEPGKPLGFLDHHIVCGNSLLGTTPALLERGIPDDAFKPLTGDDNEIVSAWKKANKKERAGQTTLSFGPSTADLAKPLAASIGAIDAIDATTPDAVHEQERRYTELVASDDAAKAKDHADAWCAAFVAPKVKGAPVITSATVRQIADDPTKVEPGVVDTVRAIADEYGFLHLHLAFPTIFTPRDALGDNPCGWSGGFSVVLGNPPWEKVQFTENEFFAARDPEIAKSTGAKRKQRIAALQTDDPALWAAFQSGLRKSEGESHFLRVSGRYPLCGRGKVNTYAVFAENMRNALAPTGRVGVIVPTGIATDDTTKHFFADCVDRRSLVSLYDFENRDKLFAAIDSRMKFCLLTLTGNTAPAGEANFVFFAHHTADLAEPERRFTLTPDDIALINPNTKTAPVFRTRRDAEITAAIYRRVPVLVRDGDPDGNPWDVEFQQGLFNMTSDSHLFRTADELRAEGAELNGNIWVKGSESWLPLYEAKMAHHFNHRFCDYALAKAGSADTQLPTPPDEQLADPSYVVQPRYWVSAPEVKAAMRDPETTWLLGFRNITNATNERTFIGVAQPTVAFGHSTPLLYASRPMLLMTMLTSYALDFVARQNLGGTNFTFFILKQLPLPVPAALDTVATWDELHSGDGWFAPRVLELTYTAWDLEGFGRHLGYDGPPFRWDPARRELLRAELDAACFHLYGIERDDVDYIMDTFPIVKRKDEKQHGEYRTKRLILEVYDAMTTAIDTGEPYQTILNPPPADPSCAHDQSTRPAWADLLLP